MLTDLRVATRKLIRQPGFTALALMILALGLGAATAMFSVVDALMLRPVPFPEGERMVRIYRTIATDHDSGDKGPSLRAFLEFQGLTDIFEGVAAVHMRDMRFESRPGELPDMMWAGDVTREYFSVLKIKPRLGRLFTPDEYQRGRDQVVVLSSQLWQARFGGDPSIVGRRIRLNDDSYTVVGVMPPEAHEPMRFWSRALLWKPREFFGGAANDDFVPLMRLIARLKPGVSIERAQAATQAVVTRLERERPTGSGVRLVPPQKDGLDVAGRRSTWLALGLGIFVLVIACINLAGIQLARLATRGQELAVRMALGAGRGRLVREMVAETLLISLVGGALSLPVAQQFTHMIASRITIGYVRASVGAPAHLDFRVFAFAIGLVLVTAIVVGALPAWLSARRAIAGTMRKAGRGAIDGSWPRLRQSLVVAQMALALMLLAAGGLFLRGLHRFGQRDPGWKVDGLLTARLSMRGPQYEGEHRAPFIDKLERRLAALPGVESAALNWTLQLWSNWYTEDFWLLGTERPRPGQAPRAYPNSVTPAYFRTVGIELREGRLLASTDGPGSEPVAVVNETMARTLWPGQSALGKRIGNAGGDPARPGHWKTIVGVVSDAHPAATLTPAETRFQVYYSLYSLAQPMFPPMVVVRTTGPPEALAADLRRAIAEVDPTLPVYEVHSARSLVDRTLTNYSLLAWTLFGFAVLGLVLSALGVYALFSGYVVQRTREIGVRMALGAQTGHVLRLVLGKGARLALLGGLLGVAGALVVAPLLSAAASELPAHEPVAVAVLALALIAVALFACWLPARRAAALDPMVALRQE
jgi:putative ABC transport system permease protein